MNTYGPLFDNNLSGGVEKSRETRWQNGKDIPECESITAHTSGSKLRRTQTSGGSVPPAHLSGTGLRDQGLAQVSEHNENWMEACINFMRVAYIKHEFTGEDIRFEVERLIGPPRHPNAYGALINTLIKRKIIVPTGEHRKMKDSRSHARSTPVYKAK